MKEIITFSALALTIGIGGYFVLKDTPLNAHAIAVDQCVKNNSVEGTDKKALLQHCIDSNPIKVSF